MACFLPFSQLRLAVLLRTIWPGTTPCQVFKLVSFDTWYATWEWYVQLGHWFSPTFALRQLWDDTYNLLLWWMELRIYLGWYCGDNSAHWCNYNLLSVFRVTAKNYVVYQEVFVKYAASILQIATPIPTLRSRFPPTSTPTWSSSTRPRTASGTTRTTSMAWQGTASQR